ncbi:MHYT domain-containing protein [Streptomyces sp. NPDC007984]|uniref:MHYT domain-containing protein n=1 Tax=Streptomyces sp. NPDC007984 TaxID=3364801 RepID=UPI0036E96A94
MVTDEVEGFRYGLVTPVAAYIMAWLGSALGLRCIVRTVHHGHGRKPAWLMLGATAMGCGIWTMHFIAMVGFTIRNVNVTYDVQLTVLSLVIAIVVVSIGVFVVGYLGAGKWTLGIAGPITGIGVAVMHYLGMAAMRFHGDFRFDTSTVVLSVLIAVGAATAALWAAVTIRGFLPALGAGLVMAFAVTGMHYTAMAAVSYHPPPGEVEVIHGQSPVTLMMPILVGPVFVLILAAWVVMFDPQLVAGEGGPRRTGADLPRQRGAEASGPPAHARQRSRTAPAPGAAPPGAAWVWDDVVHGVPDDEAGGRPGQAVPRQR